MTPQTFIFAGPSGSGKGTQVEMLKAYLAERSDAPQLHISTGAEFRRFREEKRGSHTAALSQTIDDNGKLQPYFLAVWAWADALVNRFTGAEHLLFDGSPRTVTEAEVLDSALEFYGLENVHVILINVSKEELKRRLLERGRSDDTDEAIENRLNWYESKVEPALEHYRGNERYHFHDIDGDQSMDDVYAAIIRSLSLT
ncbi:MAG: nucleoside monophosphate kinase [Candidatus Paceibacterota bacterium]